MRSKTHSNTAKFDCTVCGFKTNYKKEFSEHIGFPSHRDAAMKKLKESVN